jgi:hypothetical protein
VRVAVLLAMSEQTQWAVTLALLVVLIGAMLWSAKKKQRRLARPRRPAPIDARQTLDMRHGMEQLMVELHDLTREMNARLDTKMHALNELIIQADGRITELKALASAADQKASSAPKRKRKPRSTPVKKTPAKAVAADPVAPPAAPVPVANQRHSRIYTLADQGLSPQQIADQTDKLTGEVELILSLRAKGAPGTTDLQA